MARLPGPIVSRTGGPPTPHGVRTELDLPPRARTARRLGRRRRYGRADAGRGGEPADRVDGHLLAGQLRIATGRVFDSIDDLKMTVLSDGEELIEFFEAEAQDAAEHADRLDYLASQLSGRAVDLVVLPEFALHAAPSWASDVSTRLDAIVFAGRGHVRAGARKAHRSVVAFTDSTVLLGKTAPSTYVRGTRRWREDIHTEPPRLLMVGDGQTLVALATKDAFESADLVKILAALPPHAVVIAGASGAIASQQCEALHLAFFVARFGAPLPHRSATLQAPVNKVIEIISLFDS